MLDTSASHIAVERRGIDRSASELFDIVWRRKWLMAACITASVLLGMIYVYYAQPGYAVRARVLVQSERWPLNNVVDTQPEKEFLATQAEIISSPAVIGRVLSLVEAHHGMSQEINPLLAIQEKLAVSLVSGTNVLSLSYDCRIPNEGIATVQAIVNSYQQFLQELNDDSRLESLRLLTRSEEKLRGELEDREAVYLELRKGSPLVGRDRDATTFQRAFLETLAKALSEARRHRIDLENRVEMLADVPLRDEPSDTVRHEVMKVATRPADDTDRGSAWVRPPAAAVSVRSEIRGSVDLSSVPIPSATEVFAGAGGVATSEFALISRELLMAEMREQKLAQHCGPEHPDLRAATQQTTSWQKRLEVLAAQAPATLQRELSVAMSHERQLLQLYDRELRTAKATDDFLVKEKLELDGIDRLKSIHGSIVAQMNDWQLVEPGESGGMGAKVVVLEPPSIGAGPVWPKKTLLLSLCVAMGALSGLGIVVVTND